MIFRRGGLKGNGARECPTCAAVVLCLNGDWNCAKVKTPLTDAAIAKAPSFKTLFKAVALVRAALTKAPWISRCSTEKQEAQSGRAMVASS
jgi:hypothetical protein